MPEPPPQQPGIDIGRQQLGMVYAKALLGATEASGTTEQVLAQFDSLVTDVLAAVPKLEATLASPRVPHKAKIRILDRALAGRMTKELLVLLKVLSRRGRLDCLRAIHRAARHLYNELRGRVEVQLRTAAPLDPALTGLVANVIRGVLRSDIELAARLDADLIGGMVVRVGDTVYDGSVANRLARLRDRAIDKTVRDLKGRRDRFLSAD